jgi:hypothetical protein
LIQFAARVMVLKLSGYSQSVEGHGKQHDGPSASEHNLPLTTKLCQQRGNTKRQEMFSHTPASGAKQVLLQKWCKAVALSEYSSIRSHHVQYPSLARRPLEWCGVLVDGDDGNSNP